MENVKDTSSKNVKKTQIVLEVIDVLMVSAGSSMPPVSILVVLKGMNVPLTMFASPLDHLVLLIQIVKKVTFASTNVVLNLQIQKSLVTTRLNAHQDTPVSATNVKIVME